MNFTSQICTTKEQSERLLALGLKKETADMHYYHTVDFEGNEVWYSSIIPYENVVMASDFVGETEIRLENHTIPAWSLHRLIEMMPNNIIQDDCTLILGINADSVYYADNEYGEVFNTFDGNLYECVTKCIEWLIKEGYFNKEYLN